MPKGRILAMTATRILAEFGRTARIGPIGCNASLPELVEDLGQPFAGDRVYAKSRWPRWFGYGNLQLVICPCRLMVAVSSSFHGCSPMAPGQEDGSFGAV
ncbi:hypothetical protein GCM10010388_49970 [Streptomyces mauvecolor]